MVLQGQRRGSRPRSCKVMVYNSATLISETTSSAEWAVRGFAAGLGAELSPEMLFGIGRSASYRLTRRNDRLALQVLAPDRLMNMFSALNIPVEVYDVLCTRELAPRDLDFVRQRPVLFFANSRALENSQAGQTGCMNDDREYVWVTRCNGSGQLTWPQLMVTREFTGGKMMEGAAFAHAMAMNSLGMTRYMLWIPSGRAIKWYPKVVLEHTLNRYLSELVNSGTAAEPNGLAALEYLAQGLEDRTLQQADFAPVVLSGRNPYAYRDCLSQFFEEISEIVRDDRLRRVAVLYKRIADLWSHMLVPTGMLAGKTLNDILSTETEAVALLQRSVGGQA